VGLVYLCYGFAIAPGWGRAFSVGGGGGGGGGGVKFSSMATFDNLKKLGFVKGIA